MHPYGRDALESHAGKQYKRNRRAVAEQVEQQVLGVEFPTRNEELVRLVKQGS